MMSTASKAKKPGRPKRSQAKSKAKNTRAKGIETEQPNDVEPEDADFEVKVASPAARSTRGKKRTSEEMQAGDVEYPVIPPPKRVTGTRSSTAKPESIPALPQEDVTMVNAEDSILPPKSKKGGKGGRKRASTTTRKASGRKASTRVTSTASKASLRAPIPADEEIDAQLEADLERFSDGSDNWQVLGKDESEVTGLHFPRVRASSQKMTSYASAPKEVESSALMSHQEDVIEESESMIFERTEPILSPPAETKATKARSKRGKKATSESVVAAKEQEEAPSEAPQHMEVDTQEELDPADDVVSVPKELVAAMEVEEEQPQEDAAATQEQNNVSHATLTTVADDSGHETDGSLLAQKKAKRDSKKTTTKKSKGSKKAAPKTKKIEVTVEVPVAAVSSALPVEREEEVVPEEAPVVVVKTKTEKVAKPQAAGKRGKGKKTSNRSKIEPVSEINVLERDLGATAQSVEEIDIQPQPRPIVEVRIEQPQAPTPIVPQSPKRQIPSPTPTPQSSDAENHPPSARPSHIRPPLARFSPSTTRTMRVPLAASTPTGPPSRGRNGTKLQTTYPWTAADLDCLLLGTPSADKENVNIELLTSPEKKMNVEEWIKHNAMKGEEKLKADCERVVGRFESEGVRALKALEGILCSD